MKKNLVLVLALCMTLGVSLCACGSKQSDSASASVAETSTVASVAEADTASKADTAAEEDTSDAEASATADDAEEEYDDISGAWTLALIIDADGNEFTLAEYCEANGVDSEGLELTYTFNDDGTGTADIGGIGVDISYEINENIVTVITNENGQATDFTYEDGYLYAIDEESGMATVLSR